MSAKNRSIVILWVENKPGVLMKISSLCRRRRFNIDSLTVGTSHLPGVSHITMVFNEHETRLKNIVAQLNKLIEVISVETPDPKDTIDKELVLMIVKNEKVAYRLIKKTTHDLTVRMINSLAGKPVIEIVGNGTAVETFLIELNIKKNVFKLVRSGLIAIK